MHQDFVLEIDSHYKLCLLDATIYQKARRSIIRRGLTLVFCVITRWWCMRNNKALNGTNAVTGDAMSWCNLMLSLHIVVVITKWSKRNLDDHVTL